jgi:lysophospholipase L1-like esterase
LKYHLAVAAAVLSLSLVLLELAARAVLGLSPLEFTRPFDPFFVSGDLTPPLSRSAMGGSAVGPLSQGYHDVGGFFTYDGTSSVSITNRADFLFGHSLSRYGAQEVDRISCGPQRGVRVFVIGGSLAVGSSATNKDRSWHAILERNLRNGLGRQDVYVFNAAMGAFVSWQERLAFELAVRPRDPDLVIVMNGYNDLLFPARFGTRPGDPFQVGLRYAQIYESPVRRAVVEFSAVVATLAQRGIEREMAFERSKIESSASSIHQYATNVARTYRENISAITESCRLGGYSCIVALQPLRAVMAPAVTSGDVLTNHAIMEVYKTWLDEIEHSTMNMSLVNLTTQLAGRLTPEHFTDTVHVNDAGQRLLADALAPFVMERLKAGSRAGSGMLAEHCRN